jgi:hypothetical protein
MTAKTGLFPVSAIMLLALAAVGFGGQVAWAEDACLTTPNGPAPAGSHWYYRTDLATQHKCWSIKPLDQTQQTAPAQKTVGQEKSAIPLPAAAPARAAANSAPAPAPWTDPDPAADAATSVTWPDPPSLPPSADEAETSQAAPTSIDSPAPAMSAPATAPAPQAAAPTAPVTDSTQPANASSSADAKPDQDAPAAVKPAAEPSKVTAPARRTAAAAALAGVIGLLLVGTLLRRIIAKSLGRQRTVKVARVARREPSMVEPHAGIQPMPTQLRRSPSLVPSHAEAVRRINEVEEALRRFAQRQRAQRPAPLRTVARHGAGVRS